MKIILSLTILLIVYFFIENRFILTVRHEKTGSGIRAAHLSDLHKRTFGKNNQLLIKKTAQEHPDIIFITGDLISRSCTDFTAAGETLKALTKIAPVYLIFGNHESDLNDLLKQNFIQEVNDSGAVLLRNEYVKININDRELNLYGAELKKSVYKVNNGYSGLETADRAYFTEILGDPRSGENILLVHNPLFADAYADWGADYAFAGHVHGGAAAIPFTRIGILSPERKLFPKYTKGIYDIGGMKLFVSGGLGKLRLFNPPEIVIYEI